MQTVVINQAKRIAFQQQFGVTLLKKVKIRPSVAQIEERFQILKGKIFAYPKTKNKGGPGQFLELLLGIPTSSACLDCSDGELKLFPLKKLKNGNFSTKETVAITMRGLNDGIYLSWEESALKKKTNNLLFISYFREGDNITYLSAFPFGASCPEYATFKSDYEKITEHFKTHGICQLGKDEPGHRSNTINGKYIQSRTKGPGKKVGKGKRTISFYFRNTEFMKDVILRDITQSTHQSSSQQDS
ncbi:MAG: MutH/Sau3AI family endonuclease [Promethearchaeota archaeon]|jgi:DNA mismatch repair protein MutH